MKILVTGGCGYVGSVLIPKLLRDGHKVISIDTKWFGDYLPNHKNLKNIKFDIRKIDKFNLKNIDVINPLASISSDPITELDKNLADIKSRRLFEDLSKNFMQAQDKAIGTSESAKARQQQAASQYGAMGANIANLGGQQFQLGQQGIAGLLGAGATQRQRNQALEDAQV